MVAVQELKKRVSDIDLAQYSLFGIAVAVDN